MRIVPATPESIAEAGRLLAHGEIVVIPTETVYGLAARYDLPQAIEQVFVAKDRPRRNPLIVHLASAGALPIVARTVPDAAMRLATAFWPGPLTLVLPKADVLSSVTGGLDTVAVRVPAHAVARETIIAAGGPLAAPSANRFMGLSPTRVEHLDPEVLAHAALVLDGGPCAVGVESTVLDLTGAPRVLRPGAVSALQIAEVLGMPVEVAAQAEGHASPGLYPRHYAPRTPAVAVVALGDEPGLRFGGIAGACQVALPLEPEAAMRELYAALHWLDALGAQRLAIEMPPAGTEWVAVRDRLTKATTA